jgi:dihydrofolate reductase
MRKLIESTFVSLSGDIGAPQDWALPLSSPEGDDYARDLLFGADDLLLGRKTYQGLSSAYPTMTSPPGSLFESFVARMNQIPKHVASTTLREVTWNATLIDGDVAEYVRVLKQRDGGSILKYGTGPLDRLLLEHQLIDEFRFWLCPVTSPVGQRLFEDIDDLRLRLTGTTAFSTGIVVLSYAPG